MKVDVYSLTVEHNNGVDSTVRATETDAIGQLRADHDRRGQFAHLPDEELFDALAAVDAHAGIGFDVLDTADMEPAT
jgi:hypothetical protein